MFQGFESFLNWKANQEKDDEEEAGASPPPANTTESGIINFMNLVLESTLSAYKQQDSIESAQDLVQQLAQAHASQDLDDK
eukprot:605990-Rhodomonas_salina.1